jgi:molecular chaperone GrpE
MSEQDQRRPAAQAETSDADEAADLRERVQELADNWRRAVADLDNLRKRQVRERGRELDAERARVTAAWLPIVDDLERALEHADADPEAIVHGVAAVRDQAVEVLRGLGYPRDDEVGIPVDPARHDVVSVVDPPREAAELGPGAVIQVLRPGYGTVDHQLRPAAVAVSRGQD